MCCSNSNDSATCSSPVTEYEEKLCTVLLTNLETSFVDEQSFFLLSFDIFWLCLFLTAIEWLLILTFRLYITTSKITVLTVFFSLNVNCFISKEKSDTQT